MEFEEVRQYQAGDDIRTIDWRVTARTGKTHTKLFREEREKPVLIMIDQRQSMFFGSKQAMKSVLAADLAAYIAWAAFHKGDKIGALIFTDHKQMDIRPRRQQKTVLQLLNHLSAFNQALNRHPLNEHRDLLQALTELRRIAKPGSQIFCLSDFHDLDEACAAVLHDITQHCNVIAIRTLDMLEQELPKQGIYSATNGLQAIHFNAAQKNNRQGYEQHFQTHSESIKKTLGKFNIPLIPVYTHQNPLTVLQQYFGSKK
jgi:uncharacterized protein (DUF58 family)